MCVRILIVDDEIEFRSSLADLVKLETSHCVDLAANGEEALKLCRVINFDLLIVDYRMPVMDGVEFFRHLNHEKNLNRESQFVFLSGFVEEVSLHVEDIVSIDIKEKPIDPENILNLIAELSLKEAA